MTLLSHPRRQLLVDAVSVRTGMVLTGSRAVDVLNAAARLGNARGCGSPDDCVALAGDASFISAVVDDIIIPETYFFRQHQQLDYVLSEVVGRLEPRARLRLWSLGCASGEEVWSLAMMLASAGVLERCELVASDLSAALLQKARAGRYGPWSLRGDGAHRAVPWLRNDGADLVVDDRLRAAVRFEVLNLAHDPLPDVARGLTGFDVIFCRNVLLYLDKDVVARVGAGLFQSLVPGGHVFTAAADPSLKASAAFQVMPALGVAYRRPVRAADSDSDGDSEHVKHVVGGSSSMPAARALVRRARPQPPASARGRRHTAPVKGVGDELVDGAVDAVVGDGGGAVAGAVAGAGVGAVAGDGGGAGLRAARAAADDNDLVRALALVDALLIDDPLSLAARHLRCVVLLAQNDLDGALAEARRLLFLAPALVVGQLLLGRIFIARGAHPAGRRAALSARRELEKLGPAEAIALGDGQTTDEALRECDRLLATTEGRAE